MRLFAVGFCALFLADARAQVGPVQRHGPVRRYRETEYPMGTRAAPSVTTDTLEADRDGRVSPGRLGRHFSLFPLREKFFDAGKRGQEVTEWGNDQPRDMWHNWTYTHAYDQGGRLTRFAYSSCLICNVFAYDFAVTYDAGGRPARLVNHLNGGDEYRLYYDAGGAVVRLERYDAGKIRKRVELLP